MLHHYDQCPNILVLKIFLTGKVHENYDQDDAIPFKKWQTTDRSNLEEVELDCYDFLDEICDQIRNLTVHHFIAESQNKYFKYAEDNFSVVECVTVLDFAEIVQDAVQGFHWNSSQATIHPFVIYYEKSSQDCLDHLSVACISDHLQHDTVAVYSFQKVVLEYLKVKLLMLKKMIYFSDGYGRKYKNYKNFMNLMKHRDDFALMQNGVFLPHRMERMLLMA